MMKGYNFTERVRKVLSLARQEAARLHHEYVGSEHILLALLHEGDNVAVSVLQNVGIDVDRLASYVDAAVKSGSPTRLTGPDLPYTSRAKKVLELAMEEARNLRHNYVGTEHLLLGLLLEEKGIAAQVLVDAGLTVAIARGEVLAILGTEAEGSDDGPSGAIEARMNRLAASGADHALDRVHVVADMARSLAAESGAAEVDAIHLAIALVRHGEGAANVALERLGCDAALLLSTLEQLAPPARPTVPRSARPSALALRSALAAAYAEQREWRAPVLGTHHLLIALLATRDDLATAFGTQAVTVDRLRAEARRIVG